jgi:signal recognition particle subunit SRP54
MFDSISEKFSRIFARLGGTARLSPENIDEAVKQIRMALLEADVNFKVVKSFVGAVKEKAIGTDVTQTITPGHQFIKIVHDEMVSLLGDEASTLSLSGAGPTPIMVCGLMGSGKTTTSGKLARHLAKQKKSVLLVAADTKRAAAREQLQSIGKKVGVDVYDGDDTVDPVLISKDAMKHAARKGVDVVIIDTAGRFHIDEEMMAELERIKNSTGTRDVLLVLDSMTGQDAVTVAEQFHELLKLSGVILTKLDGDARGGAALSIRAVTGSPILYAGVGEGMEDFTPFDPQRMAGRILGMGDVVSLVEKAHSAADQEKAKDLEHRIKKGDFTLDDFLEQIRSIKKMGPIGNILSLIPGMKGSLDGTQLRDAEGELKKVEAIINSMTPKERRKHTIINGSRRKRIAKGSGTRVEDVNRLLKQYSAMNKMMKKISQGNLKIRGKSTIPFS